MEAVISTTNRNLNMAIPLAKLAVRYGLGRRRRVHLVTTDNYRVAAARQLETFASLQRVELDETQSFGTLVNEAVRTRLPLSFLAAGQRIPEDLEPATPQAVAELVCHRRRLAAARRGPMRMG